MRRKVAAICATALTLALGGSVFADDESQKAPKQGSEQEKSGTKEHESEKPPGGEMTGELDEGPLGAELTITDVSPEGVKVVQQELRDDGLYDGKIDGIAGPKTTAAITEFQRQNGLEESGDLDQETIAAMELDASEIELVSGTEEGEKQTGTAGEKPSQMGAAGEKPSQRGVTGEKPSGQKPSTAGETGMQQPAVGTEAVQLSALNPEQIRDLQQKLREHALYKGEVDGIVGPKTKGALQQFYTKQAQLAGQGMISEAAADAFGIDVSAAQPVRGSEEKGMEQQKQPQKHEGTQQAPSQQQKPEQQGQQPSQQQPSEQQRIPEQSPEY